MTIVRKLRTEFFDDNPESTPFDVYQEVSQQLVSHPGFALTRKLRITAPEAYAESTLPLVYSIFDGFKAAIEDSKDMIAYRLAHQLYLQDAGHGTEDSISAAHHLLTTLNETGVQ